MIVRQILDDVTINPGSHSYTFDTGNLPNGLYFVRTMTSSSLSVSSFVVNH